MNEIAQVWWHGSAYALPRRGKAIINQAGGMVTFADGQVEDWGTPELQRHKRGNTLGTLVREGKLSDRLGRAAIAIQLAAELPSSSALPSRWGSLDRVDVSPRMTYEPRAMVGAGRALRARFLAWGTRLAGGTVPLILHGKSGKRVDAAGLFALHVTQAVVLANYPLDRAEELVDIPRRKGYALQLLRGALSTW